MRSGAKGFTLIELLTVISIIVLLAMIIFTGLSQARQRGRISNAQSQLQQLQTAFQIYYEDYGDYPPTPPGRDFCNWCSVAKNNYYAAPPTNDALYLQQFDTDPLTGQLYDWSTVITQLQQDHILGNNTALVNDGWGNPYVYDKNYQQQGGCNGWSALCSMGPNGAIDTNNCQAWPAPPVSGGDDICVFFPND